MKLLYTVSILFFVNAFAYFPAFSRSRLVLHRLPANSGAFFSTTAAYSSLRQADTLPVNAPVIYIPIGKKKVEADQKVFPRKVWKRYKVPRNSSLVKARKPKRPKTVLSPVKTVAKTDIPQTTPVTEVEENTTRTHTRTADRRIPSKTGTVAHLTRKKNVRRTYAGSTERVTGLSGKKTFASTRPAKQVETEPSVITSGQNKAPTPKLVNDFLATKETEQRPYEPTVQPAHTAVAKATAVSKSGKSAPLDSGISVLLAAGVAAGLRRAYLKKRSADR